MMLAVDSRCTGSRVYGSVIAITLLATPHLIAHHSLDSPARADAEERTQAGALLGMPGDP
jgi:hypothetical protein